MGRVVLDGVVDIDDYMHASWLRNLLDTEKIIDYFYESCFEAADSCALWRGDDASGSDIKRRVDQMISDADASPVSLVPDDGASHVRVLTGYDIRSTFIGPVYKPLPTGFERLAVALAEALRGNYSLVGARLETPRLEDACAVDNSTAPDSGDAQTAILCGDARSQHSGDQSLNEERKNLSYWQQYVAKLVNQSPTMGAYWSHVSASCSGWRITPKWIFTGPWATPPADPDLKEDAPAAPLLLLVHRMPILSIC